MNHDQWVSTVVRAARQLELATFGVAVIDPSSGAIAYSNPSIAAAVGGDVPAHVGELGRRDLIPRPARDEILGFARSSEDATSVETWAAAPSGPARRVAVHLARLRPLRGDGVVMWAVVTSDDTDAMVGSAPPWRFRCVCDIDGTVVAVDEQIGQPGVDPAAFLGAHPYVLTHPADVRLIAPLLEALSTGEALEADYAVRAFVPPGRWANVRVHACRLEGPAPVLLITVEPEDQHLRTIEPGLLTPVELEVARALFAGRPPAQIATLRQVSIGTVRNQINAVYRKLEVAGVADLTSSYNLPLRPAPDRPRRARSPRDRQ